MAELFFRDETNGALVVAQETVKVRLDTLVKRSFYISANTESSGTVFAHCCRLCLTLRRLCVTRDFSTWDCSLE